MASVLLAGGGARSTGADRTLVVADAGSGEQLLAVPVETGAEVTLAYTHSVEKTPVRDVYVVDDGSLRMVRMEFDSYGAGLPAGADVERTDDGLVAPVDRSYDRLRVSPGSIAGHELRVGGDRYDLTALADGEVVIFATETDDETVRDWLPATPTRSAPTASTPVDDRSNGLRITTPHTRHV